MQPTIRLVVVDDHDVVRRGLKSVLELESDVSVVAEASDRHGALEAIATTQSDIVLLDLKLGIGGPSEGLDLLEEIIGIHPELAVVVFTAFLNRELAAEAIKRGARGYVQKDVDVVELLRILRDVHGGGAGFDSQTARVLIARDQVSETQLSERERSILTLVAQGCTNREIAERCFLSESTVKYHIRAMFHRFGMGHRSELARWAGSLGLTTPDQPSTTA